MLHPYPCSGRRPTIVHVFRLLAMPIFMSDPVPAMAAAVDTALTATHQAAGNADAETLSSLDLTGTFNLGPGRFTFYAEGSTTPDDDGVSTRYPTVNADAGSALDGNGDGRLQLSEAFYRIANERGSTAIGLLDATRFLDVTSNPLSGTNDGFANDETASLLNSAFVNNPAIAFPDYTLGFTGTLTRHGDRQQLRLLISSGTGITDTSNARYGELVDLGVNGCGLFTVIEGFQALDSGRALRIGLWRNSRGPEDGHGIYTVPDGTNGPWR